MLDVSLFYTFLSNLSKSVVQVSIPLTAPTAVSWMHADSPLRTDIMKRQLEIAGARLSHGRSALGICAIATLLSGCGGSQPPIVASGAMRQSPSVTAPESAALSHLTPHHATSSYAVLYRFRGAHFADGAAPYASLINVNGTLYGTTFYGGDKIVKEGLGTVFSVTPSGTEKVLYSFGHGSFDPYWPMASLVNVKGTLYDTTYAGGVYGNGTVFSVTTTGTEKVLHSFAGGADGAGAEASLVNVKGTLYGTTSAGGANGVGTVFSVTTTGTEQVLHSFAGGSDGGRPHAALINVSGTLYGTTNSGGGSGCGGYGCGTVFSVTTTGAEKVLYSFAGGSDGDGPQAGLINVSGTLYGTTVYGGANGDGTVFSISTTGTEKVLYSFAGGSDGANPYAALINVSGTLYGTTVYGGANGDGTVYSISTTGTEKVLYSFAGGSDGDNPQAGLISVSGTLYGTTLGGGRRPWCSRYRCGTVFALTP